MRPIGITHLAVTAFVALVTPCRSEDAVNVLTFHNSNDRTGQNIQERVLNTTNVRPSTFGKLFSVPLDGNAFGQPLYVASVRIAGADRSIVYVATSRDSVYAIDARNGAIAWKVNLGAPVPRLDVSEFSHAHMLGYVQDYYDLYPDIGITSTPVIDVSTQTLFAVAKTKELNGGNPAYKYTLHALDLIPKLADQDP